jgi:hypothetical protein
MTRLRPEWVASFRRVTGTTLNDTDFLTLEESDTLRNAFAMNAKAPETTHRYWPARTSFSEIVRAIVGLAEHPEPVVVFHRADSQIGAILLPPDEVLKDAENLRELLGGDISLMTKDARNGLCLEKTFYEADGEYVTDGVWELTAWGGFARSVSETSPSLRR